MGSAVFSITSSCSSWSTKRRNGCKEVIAISTEMSRLSCIATTVTRTSVWCAQLSSTEITPAAKYLRPRTISDAELMTMTNEFCLLSVPFISSPNKRDATEFRGEVDDIRKKVLATGHVVKRSVDDQINSVLSELRSVRSESTEQARSVRDAYRLAIMSMESFHTESQELLDRGRPSDVTQAARELHDRATELSNGDVAAVRYRPPDVTFTAADVTQAKRLNLIGKLTVRTKEQSGVSDTFACQIHLRVSSCLCGFEASSKYR